MTTYIHNADIGTIFRLTITDTDEAVIDVSSASVKYLYFQKPDGTKIKRTATFYTDGSDGIIQYTSISGDIDQTGLWQVQGYVETSDGKFFTEKTGFSVLATLYTAS
jgi:hypothetical protein